MKKIIAVLICSISASQATLVQFDLSPPGTDSGVGLVATNEVPPVTNSVGSGGEISGGIVYNTTNGVLQFAVGYGASVGFSNLLSAAILAHIHAPAVPGSNAPVVIDLAPYHFLSIDPANGGVIIGAIPVPVEQSSNLLSGLAYINIHTTNYPTGEIRAQLIPLINTIPTIECPAPVTTNCTSNGTEVVLVVRVSDAEGDPLTVIWSAGGVPLLTNSVPAGTPGATNEVPLTAEFDTGITQVDVSVSDGQEPVTCSTTVTVVDTTPPVIQSINATPNVLWPPNHKLVNVRLRVVARDDCGTATSKIVSVSSSEPQNGLGDGDTANDWIITGDLTVKLRAERAGKGPGRVYTIVVDSTDGAGNTSTGNVTVFVPHDKGKKSK